MTFGCAFKIANFLGSHKPIPILNAEAALIVIFLYPPHSFIILFNFSVVSLIVHPVHKDLCSQVDELGVTV